MGGFRFMRMLVFFDLPTLTGEDRRNYRIFRKKLLKSGFYMLQESVYCKLLTSPTVEKSVKNMLENIKPPEGLVQSLVVTENQFAKMDYIVGIKNDEVIDNEERLIIL